MRTSTITSPPFNKFLTAMVIIAMMLAALPVQAVSAATITVNTVNDEIIDDANCSLREAIMAANMDASVNGCAYVGTGPDDIITLASGQTYTLTRVGGTDTTGDLDVHGNLTIQASGSTDAIIDANGINRALEAGELGDVNLTLINITIMNGNSPDGAGIYFDGGGTLTLQNSAILNNVATGAQNCGAGIYNGSPATIVINNSTIAGNSCSDPSSDGAGLYKNAGGSVTITNSTFSGNTAGDNGGGANFDVTGGTMTIRNSTFANNTAGGRGGGIQVANGTVTIEFSTFSGNAANMDPVLSTSIGGAVQATGGSVEIRRSILANSTNASGMPQDCDQFAPGAISVTNSIVEINSDCALTSTSNADPGLGSLANNGGPTMTMAITDASPAYNAALSCASVTTDQRGVTRPQGASCDLGAYEFETGSVAPGAATLVSPSGSIVSNNPTYTWNEVSNATWYYLWVNGPSGNIFKQWYTSAQANCNGSTCSVAGATPNLGGGAHTWWIQTWNDAGGFGPWSSGMSFSIAPPGKATLVSPTGNIGTNAPTYTWNEVDDATWYYLWVNGPSGNVIKQWYTSAQANCNGSTCSVTHATTLAAGTHTWWIQTWNDTAGYGPWSDGMTFTPTPPGKATLVSPSGSIGSNTPSFTWNEVDDATWYYLWVNGPSGNVIKQWYTAAQANCNGSTCSVTSPVTLGSGTHTWWIQTWNTAGFGPWSDARGFSTP